MNERQDKCDSSRSCDVPRQALLEADLAELRGTADSALATHIQECEHCQETSRMILDGYAALDSVLNRQIEIDARQVVAEADASRTTLLAGVLNWFSTTPAIKWSMASVLIATVTLTVLFGSRSRYISPVEKTIPPAPMTAETTPHTIKKSDFAVFQTDNPNIKIYWYF